MFQHVWHALLECSALTLLRQVVRCAQKVNSRPPKEVSIAHIVLLDPTQTHLGQHLALCVLLEVTTKSLDPVAKMRVWNVLLAPVHTTVQTRQTCVLLALLATESLEVSVSFVKQAAIRLGSMLRVVTFATKDFTWHTKELHQRTNVDRAHLDHIQAREDQIDALTVQRAPLEPM